VAGDEPAHVVAARAGRRVVRRGHGARRGRPPFATRSAGSSRT
jgi:hypothetical protein